MPTYLPNRIDPFADVTGTQTQKQNLTRSEEPLQLGSKIPGQSGSSAIIINSAGTVTISGLTGMISNSLGRFLTISGAASGVNNGTFAITTFNSSTSVDISNSLAVSDFNNGLISWVERNSYSLEDDLNYIRTDRKLIKGTTNYYDALPTYVRPTATNVNVDTSLANIAGKTTDAKAFVLTRKLENANVLVGDGYIFCSSPGNFPYADSIDTTGIPINDGFDVGNYEASYCEIIDPNTDAALEVRTGINVGNRIFGRSRQGIFGIDGNSFECELRSVPKGDPISSSIAYIWESGQPSIVDIFHGFRNRLDTTLESAFRTTFVNGLSGGSGMPKPTQIGQILYSVESDILQFVPAKPVVNDDGFIMVDENDNIVVTL